MGFVFLVTSALLGYVSGGFFLIMFFDHVIFCACLIVKCYFLGYNVRLSAKRLGWDIGGSWFESVARGVLYIFSGIIITAIK